MSTATQTKKEPSLAVLVLVLCAISAATALVLALINMLTAPVIAQNEENKRNEAMAEVLPASGYTQIDYTGSDPTIDAVFAAEGGGYVFEVSPTGSFSGTFTIMVGVDAGGTVTGTAVTKTAETSGLGANAGRADFRAQFVGATGSTAVDKDGGNIESLTGATITARCMSNGVNSALTAVAEMG